MVKQEFQFSPHEAPATNERPSYRERAVEQIEAALIELHQYEKKKARECVGNNDEFKSKGTTAGGKYKHDPTNKSKAGHKNDDELKENEYSTAGGKQYGFKDDKHSTAGDKQSVKGKDSKAGGKYKHGTKDKAYSKAGGKGSKGLKGLKGVAESDEDNEEDDDFIIKPLLKADSDMDLCESEFSFI